MLRTRDTRSRRKEASASGGPRQQKQKQQQQLQLQTTRARQKTRGLRHRLESPLYDTLNITPRNKWKKVDKSMLHLNPPTLGASSNTYRNKSSFVKRQESDGGFLS